MCNWHWSIVAEAADGGREHLGSIRYGDRRNPIGEVEALRRALRHAAAWKSRNPERAESLKIENVSCNGGHETVFPFLPEGAQVEPEHSWDESDAWLDDEEESERDCLLWSALSDELVDRQLTKSEARERVQAAKEEGRNDLAAFRVVERRDGSPLYLCLADASGGAYWRRQRRPLHEAFPTVSWKRGER